VKLRRSSLRPGEESLPLSCWLVAPTPPFGPTFRLHLDWRTPGRQPLAAMISKRIGQKSATPFDNGLVTVRPQRSIRRIGNRNQHIQRISTNLEIEGHSATIAHHLPGISGRDEVADYRKKRFGNGDAICGANVAASLFSGQFHIRKNRLIRRNAWTTITRHRRHNRYVKDPIRRAKRTPVFS
jgi:hypothetical protein